MNVIDRIVNKYLTALTLFFAVCFPKVAFISTGYNSGVRTEDLLIVIVIFYQIASGEFAKIIKTDRLWAATKPFVAHMCCALIGIILAIVYKFTVSSSNSFLFWFRQFEYVFVIIIGYKFMQNWTFKQLLKLIDFIYIVMGTYAVLQYFNIVGGFIKGQKVESYGESSRVFSTTNGPYEYAGYLAIMAVYYFCLCLYFNRSKFRYILAASSLVLILMTESRMALVAVGVAIILIVFKRTPIGGLIATMIGSVAYMISDLMGREASVQDGRLSRFQTLDLKQMYDAFIYDFQNGDFDYFLKTRDWHVYHLTADLSYDIRMSHWGTAYAGLCTNILTFMFGCGMATISTMDGNYMRFFFESGLIGLICWILFIRQIYKGTKLEFDCSKDLYMFSLIMRFSLIALLLQAIMIDIFEASKVVYLFWFLYGAFMCMYKKEEAENINSQS